MVGELVRQSVIDAAARGDETDCVLGTVVAVAQDDTVRRRHDSTAKCSVIMEKLVGESVAGDKVPRKVALPRLLSAGEVRGGCDELHARLAPAAKHGSLAMYCNSKRR